MQDSRSPPDASVLMQSGIQAIRAGQHARARVLLEQAAQLGRSDVQLWLAMAYACHGAGDPAAKLIAIDRVLAIDDRNLPALIMKGDHFMRAGDDRSASSFFAAALRFAPPPDKAPPDLALELRRVQSAQTALAQRFDAHLKQGLAAQGFDASRSSGRFTESLEIMAGRQPVYLQQPRFYYLPGLPNVGFYPRALTPWLDSVEAATEAIRAELMGVLGDPEAFAPYVEDRTNRPNSAKMGMAGNADWSAFYLWKDGVPVEGNIARCPRTIEALAQVPLSHVASRSPSILFSMLKAGARIPPHHGMVNTRLICHLPLITPPGCRFRVGGDTRTWEQGKAWAFDDTIEHEAWNDSGETRIILIFDAWKPEITAEEQGLIASLFQTIDAYGQPVQSFGV